MTTTDTIVYHTHQFQRDTGTDSIRISYRQIDQRTGGQITSIDPSHGDMEILNGRRYNVRTQGKSLEKFQAHREFDSADGPRQGLDPAGVGAETKEYRNAQTVQIAPGVFSKVFMLLRGRPFRFLERDQG